MVSKVRALHRENPDRSDEDLKEYLITLMSNAGLALPATTALEPSKSKPAAATAALAPPAPPPPPQVT